MVPRSQEPETTAVSKLAYQDTASSHPASSAPGIGHNGGPPLSNNEAAEYIGFSPSWMRQSRMPGKAGPPYHRIGRSIRYSRGDLDQWLAQRRCVPGAEQSAEPGAMIAAPAQQHGRTAPASKAVAGTPALKKKLGRRRRVRR
jgi:predicted DNA-binding transcriptional regulator AlpA